MIHVNELNDCCGCTACCTVCRKGAIIMKEDAKGFKYPFVNLDLCVDCGLCEKVCPIQNAVKLHIPQRGYCVRHKNIEHVKSSRSGAAFVAISDAILNLGGVVYGATFDADFKVVHRRADNTSQRDSFKGSKYTQSNLDDIFSLVVRDLNEGRYVLFTGTPCQVAGLRNVVPVRLLPKLFLVDLVCHSVSSPKIWDDYLRYIKKLYGKEFASVSFRDKQKGWASHYESFSFIGGGKKVFRRSFADLFYKNLINRESCGNCKFSTRCRVGDITLADFWGWESVTDINKDNLGVSLCLVSTEKGARLLSMSGEELHLTELSPDSFEQPNLCHPTLPSPLTNSFWADFSLRGFPYVLKKYGENNLRSKLGRVKFNLQLAIRGKKNFLEIFDVLYR